MRESTAPTLLLFCFVTSICLAEQNSSRPQIKMESEQPIEYRIVWNSASNVGADPTIKRYDISVNRQLDKKDFEDLVCRFIRNEKPSNYETLRLHFYYNFNEYLPDISNPAQRRKNVEHFLGSYTWNEYWAKRKGGGTLYIVKDKSGKELPKPESFSFDHFKACKDQ